MYLVSIYFDEKTNQRIQKYIEQVAEKTGNTFMVDGNVPPHITIGAFESKASQTELIEALDRALHNACVDIVKLVSVGIFQNSAIFLSAVYNEYLHEMCKSVCRELQNVENTMIRKNYQPFNWMPHVTIGKTLSRNQQLAAFEELQSSFGPLEATAVSVGVSKTNPYSDIYVWRLT